MVKIKICGITNLADALAAVEAGADALGFNFYRPSPRDIEPETARAIIEQLPTTVMTVGVFANEQTEVVAGAADQACVTAIQLHGDESPEYCRAFGGRYVIKVIKAKAGFRPEHAAAYTTQAIMLDAFDPDLLGGTGQTIDWSLAARTRALVNKLYLSGGLSPENIAAAVLAVQPYAVDACSRLESAPGRKDREAMRSFITAARSVTGT